MRTADPSADGRRSAVAIFRLAAKRYAIVELASPAAAYRLAAPRGDALLKVSLEVSRRWLDPVASAGLGRTFQRGVQGADPPVGIVGAPPLQLNVLSYFASPDEAANLPRY